MLASYLGKGFEESLLRLAIHPNVSLIVLKKKKH